MPDEEWLANLLHAFGYELDSEFCGHIEECSLSFVWAQQLPTHRLVWNVAPNHSGNRRTLEQDANELGMGLRISVSVSDPPIDVHRQAAAVVVQIRSEMIAATTPITADELVEDDGNLHEVMHKPLFGHDNYFMSEWKKDKVRIDGAVHEGPVLDILEFAGVCQLYECTSA